MSDAESQAQGQEAEAAEGSLSILEQAIGATKQTERDETQDLLKNLTEQALSGTVSWDKNLTVTINKAIAAIEQEKRQKNLKRLAKFCIRIPRFKQ